MVYVTMLADAVLRDESASVPEIAAACFARAPLSGAKKYFAQLQKDIPYLPPCPAGSFWDDHKGSHSFICH